MTEKELQKGKTREILGAMYLACAVFLLLCLATYHPLDPSFTHFAAGNAKTHNLVGSVGSHIADSLIRLFGIGAFVIPLVFSIIAFRYFLDESFKIKFEGVAGLIGLIFSTSSLFAVIPSEVQIYSVKLNTGGLLGRVSVEFLNGYLNLTGTYIMLFLILIISLIITVDLSIVALGRRCKDIIITTWYSLKRFFSKSADLLKRKKGESQEEAGKTVPMIDAALPATEKTRNRKSRNKFISNSCTRTVLLNCRRSHSWIMLNAKTQG